MSTYNQKNIENNAHDARREMRTAVSELQTCIDMVKIYTELEFEEAATSGLAINITDLIGRVGRTNADAVEALTRALRYTMQAVPDVEAMLTERMAQQRESVTTTRLEA